MSRRARVVLALISLLPAIVIILLTVSIWSSSLLIESGVSATLPDGTARPDRLLRPESWVALGALTVALISGASTIWLAWRGGSRTSALTRKIQQLELLLDPTRQKER